MTTPALPSNDRFVDLSPSAGTTALDYDFELKSEAGLTVLRTRAGARATLVNGTDYDFLTGLGDETGGTITLLSASLAGDRYVLLGLEPIERASDLLDSNAFSASRYNEEGDLLAIFDQEQRRDIDRAIKSDYGQAGLSIDTSVVTAGKVLMRGTGNDVVAGPDADEIAAAQGYAEDALASKEAADETLADFLSRVLGSFATDELATAAAGGAPITGALYWNPGTAKFRVWSGSAWGDAFTANNHTVDTFTGDGTTDPLTLSGNPGSINNVTVIIEGLGPQPKAAFTLAGDQLTPSEAWPDGAGIEVTYGTSIEIGVPSDGSVTRAKMADNAIGADEIDATEAEAIKTKLGIAAASTLVPGFFTGFKLANSGSHGIVFNPGAAWSDDGDPILIVLATATTKLINATFVAGTGNGGLDTGTVAAGTYHAWAVANDDGSTVDVIFSLSASAPTMPSGFTKKAYLWPVMRGASSNWVFAHTGDTFTIGSATATANTPLSATAANVTLPGVPTGFSVEVSFLASVFSTSQNLTAFFSSPLSTEQSAASGVRASLVTSGSSRWVSGGFSLITNTSAQIRALSDFAISNCSLIALSWRFLR